MRGWARGRAMGAAVAAALALGACSPIYRNHGYAPTESELAALQLGVDTRDSVAATLGRPTTSGVLEGQGFYYVQSRFRHFGLLEPQEVSREVLALSFAADGTLGAIERFDLSSGRAVPISRRTTPGVFADPGFLAQISANFGGIDTSQFFDDE